MTSCSTTAARRTRCHSPPKAGSHASPQFCRPIRYWSATFVKLPGSRFYPLMQSPCNARPAWRTWRDFAVARDKRCWASCCRRPHASSGAPPNPHALALCQPPPPRASNVLSGAVRPDKVKRSLRLILRCRGNSRAGARDALNSR